MTVRRLSVYTRCLLQLEEDGVKTISSQELAERFSLNSAQVRKDLAYFGEFGVRGIGYYVSGLKAELQRILGLDREWPVALVGFGNLGSALFHYKGFARQGFRIVADLRRRSRPRAGSAVDGVPIHAHARPAARGQGAQSPDRDRGGAGGVRPGGHREARGGRHQGHSQLRARPHQGGQGRPAQERRPLIELETLSFYLAKGSR